MSLTRSSEPYVADETQRVSLFLTDVDTAQGLSENEFPLILEKCHWHSSFSVESLCRCDLEHILTSFRGLIRVSDLLT